MKSKLVFLAFFTIASLMALEGSPKVASQPPAPPDRFLIVTASALTGKDYGQYVLNQGYNLIVGWRWNKGFRAGLGSGFEKFDEYVLPFFAFTAIPLGGSINSPFLYAKAGYGIGFASAEAGWDNPGFLGGILLGGGANVTLFSWNRLALRGGLGYRFQKISGKIQSSWSLRRILEYGRMDFHLALSFW